MTDDAGLIEARRHVAALKGFYIHLIIFACVMSGLVGLDVATGAGWWVQWPLLGWGVGIVGHAVSVYSPFSLFGRDWEERKIKQHLAARSRPPEPKAPAEPATLPPRNDRTPSSAAGPSSS